ncbi:uncharacterized protein CTRU02_202447 [Colletotrichum truncatum]|uniref:Uncharacterized protein n=1 Tax=Colletotrichum truncatum TaxID=5467 RepID=A0ACC3ZKD3_COLTU|nr:uncharacterized protein CTRU02_01614 [Colletotrichum truncatum]KAF6799935.1 hypothetical protein CTRU02_01614 [Colletotrichum truncatum]
MSQSIRGLVTADPGLPHPHPTESYWLSVPHRLAGVQSPELPQTADVVIIGSGITGTSTAFHALEEGHGVRVAVLEARTLCSGATGRNGGHVTTYGAILYAPLKQVLGRDLAYEVLNFTFANVDEVAKVSRKYALEESQYRSVERIRCFTDEDSVTRAKASVTEWENDFPEESGKYTFIGPEEARNEHGMHGIAGAVRFAAGALWPYGLIMKIWDVLLEKYPGSLTVDAKTPVTSVSLDTCTDSKYKYKVQTSRGTIRAAKVVYATNAHTSHLLPKIRGLLYPFKESMTVQDLNHEVPNRGNTTTWSVHGKPTYNATTKRTEMGTLYLQQNALSGYSFFGGGYANAVEAITPDDSTLAAETTPYFQRQLSRLFGQKHMDRNLLIGEWTGIQGFTADETPLVGPLPQSLTERGGEGEWIGAGYNGGGMAWCWMVGKALAGMMRGEDVSGWFPEILIPSEERLTSSLTVENSVESMQDLFAYDSTASPSTAMLTSQI